MPTFVKPLLAVRICISHPEDTEIRSINHYRCVSKEGNYLCGRREVSPLGIPSRCFARATDRRDEGVLRSRTICNWVREREEGRERGVASGRSCYSRLWGRIYHKEGRSSWIQFDTIVCIVEGFRTRSQSHGWGYLQPCMTIHARGNHPGDLFMKIGESLSSVL